MMNKLYHKITYPSGRVRYVEAQEWDTGRPADGLWVVRRSGQSKTWLSEQIAIRPQRLEDAAWIADHIDEITRIIIENRPDVSIAIARKIVVKLMEEA